MRMCPSHFLDIKKKKTFQPGFQADNFRVSCAAVKENAVELFITLVTCALTVFSSSSLSPVCLIAF